MLDAYLREYHTVAEHHLAIRPQAKVNGQASGAADAAQGSRTRQGEDARAVKQLDKQMHEMTDACMRG